MVRAIVLLLLLSSFLCQTSSEVSAKEIRIDFAGSYIGAFTSPPHSPRTYSASIFFETDDGILTDLWGSFLFVGPLSGGTSLGAVSDVAYVSWSDYGPPTFGLEIHAPGYGYNSLTIGGPSGSFQQYGTCPSHCAFLGVAWVHIFDGVAPVPAPLSGSGLVGLASFALGGLFLRRTRKAGASLCAS
jgi:hypothetical protein